MDPVFEAWAERGSPERLEAIFGRLSTLEEPGHLPALQRLYDLTKKTGDKTGMSRTLESLVRTYRARSLNEEADEALDRLKEIAPHSSLIASASGPAEQEAATASAAPEQAAESNETPAPSSADEAMPVDVEAPAVPLNRSDEEFVAGRLTQAEILEKYGLLDQAMEQVREVTLKFPGHVPAQERRLALLRTGTDRRQTGDALVGLALARRAQGDTEGARQVAAEADQMEAVSAPMRARLARLGLLEDGAAPAAAPAPVVLDEPAPAPAVEADSAPAAPVVVETAAGEAPVSGPPPTRAQEPGDAPAPVVAKDAEQGSVLIDFDALEGEQEAAPVEEAPPAEPAAAPPAPPTAAQPPTAGAKMVRPPGEDMLEEIRLQLQGGMADEASRRVKTLRALGYGSDELDLLEKQIGEAVAAAPVAQPAPAVESEVSTESSTVEVAAEPDAEQVEALAAVVADREDDDDLSTITAALESELFSEEVEAPVPEAQTEQSLEDVFAAFKQHVAEEVGSEDTRTHYDLGIAYKEMGLMDEAIGEFELAARSGEVTREAAIMLALCYREREETKTAAEWYRRAIDEPGGDAESVSGLRYELAEMLLGSGDVEGALKLFREVLAADPCFRDVQERVTELESSPTA
jgi:tetratricopeptide (TPR) repeat protein